MTLADIIQSLPQLSNSELKALIIEIDKFLINTTELNEELAYAIMTGVGSYVKLDAFKKLPCYKTFLKNQSYVEELLLKITDKKELTRIERKKLYRMFVTWLNRYMKENNIPLTLSCISQQFVHSELIFEANFPGYLESGIAQMVLKIKC